MASMIFQLMGGGPVRISLHATGAVRNSNDHVTKPCRVQVFRRLTSEANAPSRVFDCASGAQVVVLVNSSLTLNDHADTSTKAPRMASSSSFMNCTSGHSHIS
jgi:hypothetical protein